MGTNFTLDEAVILVDAYLRMKERGATIYAAAKETSAILRSRAVAIGMDVDESFRTVQGIINRLSTTDDYFTLSFDELSDKSSAICEAIVLYKKNPKKFEALLKKAMSIVKSPPEELEDSYEEPTDRIEDDNGGGSEIDNSEEFLYEFDKGTELTNTRPLRAQFENGEGITTNSWTDVYFWIVKVLYRQFPERFQEVLHENLEKGIIADFLDSRKYDEFKGTYRYSLKKVDDNFYLNTNHSATTIGTKIYRWLKTCGLKANSLKIYYAKKPVMPQKGCTPKQRTERKEQQRDAVKFDYNVITTATKVAVAIRERFSNGFRFDDSSLSLLTSALGERVDYNVLNIVKDMMFSRKDGVCFFSDLVIDSTSQNNFLKQINRYLDLNSGFESSVLYEKYRDHLNSSCVRNADDFEAWLGKMTNDEIKVFSVGKHRIARLKKYRNDDEYIDALLTRIRNVAKDNYGTIEEAAIVKTFDGFSLDCLCRLVKTKADDVFVKEINETICFQTFEGLGIPEGFSASIQKALDKTDKLGLPPSLEVLTTLLAADLGTNPRQEYGIADDKAFKKLIEACYRGEVPRKWKSNVFGKDEP